MCVSKKKLSLMEYPTDAIVMKHCIMHLCSVHFQKFLCTSFARVLNIQGVYKNLCTVTSKKLMVFFISFFIVNFIAGVALFKESRTYLCQWWSHSILLEYREHIGNIRGYCFERALYIFRCVQWIVFMFQKGSKMWGEPTASTLFWT